MVVAKQGGVQVRNARQETLEAFGYEYLTKYAKVELAAATMMIYRHVWNTYVIPRLGSVSLSALDG